MESLLFSKKIFIILLTLFFVAGLSKIPIKKNIKEKHEQQVQQTQQKGADQEQVSTSNKQSFYPGKKNTTTEKHQKTILKNFYLNSGDYDFTIKHDGLIRRYKVHVPPSYDKKTPLPVILAFHGGTGNADKSPSYFQLNPKSDKEGFIVVYPEGTGKKILGTILGSWNGGTCCGPAFKNNVDDVGFIKKMLTKLEQDFNIDEKRIYATGMSNGAIMSYALACEMSDKIAAIAPSGSIGHYRQCDQTRPVPTIHFHGTDDPCAVYDGCDGCEGCVSKYLSKMKISSDFETMNVMSVPKFIDNWRKRNGCSSETKVTYKHKNATCITYQECKENAEVTLCTIKGMGHVWPGRPSYSLNICKTKPNGYMCTAWKETVGKLSTDISANDMMWNFFKKHHLP